MRYNLPTLQASEVGRPRHRVRNPLRTGVGYELRLPLYDTFAATVATALALRRLFQIPIGAQFTPIGGAAVAKTLYHTNMDNAGTLAAPQKYFTKSVQVAVRSDIDIVDVRRFLFDTLLTFQIGERIYSRSHLFSYPGAGGPNGLSAGLISNGEQNANNNYTLPGPMGETIEVLQNFFVTLDPALVSDAAGAGVITTAAAAAGGAGINALVTLDGMLTREVQ